MKMEALLVNVVLPLANALILLSVGLALQPGDFRSVTAHPGPLTIGLIGHYVLLPAIGFAVAWGFRHTPAIAVGFVLIAACPSASASNLLTHMARGNAALAVALTAISALATLVTLPLLVNLAGRWFHDGDYGLRLPVIPTVVRLTLLVLLPVVAGLVLRIAWPRLTIRAQPWLAGAGLVALLLAIGTYVVVHFTTFADSFKQVGLASLLMCTCAMAAGLLLGYVSGLQRCDAITVGMEMGIQNCMLALVVALTLLRSNDVALPAIAYGVAMFLPAFVLVVLGRRWMARPRGCPSVATT